MSLDELDDAGMNFLETGSEGVSRARADDSTFDKPRRRRALAFYNAIASDRGSRINTENYHVARTAISASLDLGVALALCVLFYVTVGSNFLYIVQILELLEQLDE
jgi:hypothetical protein